MKILKDQIDTNGEAWSVVFVFEGAAPDWARQSSGTILCLDGYENAVGWLLGG